MEPVSPGLVGVPICCTTRGVCGSLLARGGFWFGLWLVAQWQGVECRATLEQVRDLRWLYGCGCLGKGLREEGQGRSENSCFFLRGFKPSTRERGSLLK